MESKKHVRSYELGKIIHEYINADIAIEYFNKDDFKLSDINAAFMFNQPSRIDNKRGCNA